MYICDAIKKHQMRRATGLILLLLPLTSWTQVPDSTFKLKDTSEVVVFSLTADDLENDAQNQDISTLLQSSRDVFASIAGFNFSNARYQIRGLESDQYSVLINGVPMNDPEMGWGIYSYWGGLNDVTRYPESGIGLGSSNYNFSGVGGFSNMDLRASADKKESRVSYAMTNRTYRNRLMFTHSTGQLSNGWAVTFSGSYRWSQEGYVEGTYFSGASYFLSVEKKINAKHSIGLVGFGAPTVQGRSGIAVQEAFNLTENNYYNPYWGWQTDGNTGEQVKRNAHERNNHRPSVFLNHYWTPNKNITVNSALYGTFGKTGNSNLNWNDAQDPRPDYYKYLPSYTATIDPTASAQATAAWGSDQSVSQINWDGLYNANYNNTFTQNNIDGIAGNSLEFKRSRYIMEEYRSDPLQLGFNSIYTRRLSDEMLFSGGVNIDRYVSRNYRKMLDLMGGDYWLDVNQFAEQSFADPNISQNNIDLPNHLVAEGETFGYDYNMHVNTQTVFGQIKDQGKKIDWYAALELSHTNFFREGNIRNGQFPNESFGVGEKHNYINYGVKGGLVYKITGRHFININAIYQTKAPYSYNVYISPRNRDKTVDGMTNMQIMSGDINYQVRYPNFRARATAYYSQINDGTYSKTFYHDLYRNFVNYTMTNVDQLYSGIELGAEATIATDWTVSAAFGTGQFLYNSRPVATVTVNNSPVVIAEDQTVYLKNFHIGGMPQTAGSIGLKYSSPKYWFAGASFNYFTNIYIDPNPARRTEEALSKYTPSDPQWNEIVGETVIHTLKTNKFFDNNYTLDMYIGGSIKIKDKMIRLSASVNNILNNTSFRTGGFEQLRFDSTNIGKFPPKYGYMYGTSYFLMVTYLF